MTDQTPLSDQLINLENAEPEQLREFEQLMQAEAQHERKVFRLALYAWSTAFVCLVVVTASSLMVREMGGAFVNVARFALVVAAGTGLVAVFSGTLFTTAWLFRSRTPTLRVIERRLARLETLLEHR